MRRSTPSEFGGAHEDCPLYCGQDARRACSRLGENRYSLTRNNCEHFCNWCMHGVNRSVQVERLLAVARAVERVLRKLVPCLAPALRHAAVAAA